MSAVKRKFQREPGQAIVLIAFIMIALIGMLGLAIDGGRLFYLKRDLQNAADAGAVVAGYSACTGNTLAETAVNVARPVKDNGFIDDGGITTSIEVTQTGGETAEAVKYTKVMVKSRLELSFAQIFAGQYAWVSATATMACQPKQVIADATVVGLSKSCDNAVSLAISNATIDGAVVSNSDLSIDGFSNTVNGDGYYTDTENTSSVFWNPNASNPISTTGIEIAESFMIDDFFGSGQYAAYATSRGQMHYYPDSAVIDATGPTIDLHGLYAAEGDIVLMGNNYTINKNGVTFVSRNGQITVSGNTKTWKPYIKSVTLGGVLIFSNMSTDCNTFAISVSSSASSWTGMIFAPQGRIEIPAGNNSVFARVIGQAVSGSGDTVRFTDIQVQPAYGEPKIWIAE